MKAKLILYICISLVTIFMACEKKEYNYQYDGPLLAQFVEATGTFFVLENSTESYNIPIQLVGQQQVNDVVMNYSVLDKITTDDGYKLYSTISPEDQIVSLGSNTITIPAGESTGVLKVTGNYNKLEFGVVDTMLLLLEDGQQVQADSYEKFFLMKVQKYYPFVQNEFLGKWSGTFIGALLGETATAPGLTIIAGETESELVITEGFYQEQIDDWGETWTDGPYPISIYMNTDDPTNFLVEIPEKQYIGTTDDEWDYWVASHPDPGQFNAASREMSLKFYCYVHENHLNDIVEYKLKLSEPIAKVLITNGINQFKLKTVPAHTYAGSVKK